MTNQPKIKRRTALGLVGLTAAMAGCFSDDDDHSTNGTTDDSQDNETVSDTETETNGESELNVAQLINDHEAYVETTGFTMNVRVESPNLSDGTEKQTVFQQDTDTLDSRVIESVPGADIEEAIHEFTDTEQHVEFTFADGTTSEDVLDVPDGAVWTLTGVSVFDKFLVGAAVELAEETDTTRTYHITSHRTLDIKSGRIVVTDENVITDFRLTWEHDTTNTISTDLSDIGNTYL